MPCCSCVHAERMISPGKIRNADEICVLIDPCTREGNMGYQELVTGFHMQILQELSNLLTPRML